MPTPEAVEQSILTFLSAEEIKDSHRTETLFEFVLLQPASGENPEFHDRRGVLSMNLARHLDDTLYLYAETDQGLQNGTVVRVDQSLSIQERLAAATAVIFEHTPTVAAIGFHRNRNLIPAEAHLFNGA